MKNIEILKTIIEIKKNFPFKNYNDTKRDYIDIKQNSHLNIVSNILKVKNSDSTILDFGCGPLDKTAILKKLGYKCYAIDDHNDDWHLKDNNKAKIYQYAKSLDISLYNSVQNLIKNNQNIKFDLIMLNDIIEHLHNSPRFLLNELDPLLKKDGFYLITVPNSLNLKKRIKVLCGKTNYVEFRSFFLHEGNTFRGHVREYSKDCLSELCEIMNYEIIKLRGCNQMLHRIPNLFLPMWKIFTNIFPNLSDSYILIAKKK